MNDNSRVALSAKLEPNVGGSQQACGHVSEVNKV